MPPKQLVDHSAEEFTESAAEYADRYGVYEIFESLLQELVIAKPEDPVTFLVDVLKQQKVLKVSVMGPPGSGKTTQARRMAKDLGLVLLSKDAMVRLCSARRVSEPWPAFPPAPAPP